MNAVAGAELDPRSSGPGLRSVRPRPSGSSAAPTPTSGSSGQRTGNSIVMAPAGTGLESTECRAVTASALELESSRRGSGRVRFLRRLHLARTARSAAPTPPGSPQDRWDALTHDEREQIRPRSAPISSSSCGPERRDEASAGRCGNTSAREHGSAGSSIPRRHGRDLPPRPTGRDARPARDALGRGRPAGVRARPERDPVRLNRDGQSPPSERPAEHG